MLLRIRTHRVAGLKTLTTLQRLHELAKTQIIAQAGTAMLAQANQIKQTVLALLQ